MSTIIDSRKILDFKKYTFCNYKKKDVISTLFKSIQTKQVESACYWFIECIVSGYVLDIWDRIIIFTSKVITINNPILPSLLNNKNSYLYNYIHNKYNEKDKQFTILLRNDSIIRNLSIFIVCVLTISSKSKRFDKYPSLKDDDFNVQNIENRCNATMNLLPNNFIRFNEPDELRIICNELYYNLKNNIGGDEKSMYWIIWIMEWEKKNIKNGSWNIDTRNIEGIQSKHKNNIIWIIWELILLESSRRPTNIQIQINSLYDLYRFKYSPGKRNKRLPHLYNAVCYLTNTINFNIPIISNIECVIKTQLNINNMFLLQKINENKINNKINNKDINKDIQKKKVSITNKDICLDKLSVFNDLDPIL